MKCVVKIFSLGNNYFLAGVIYLGLSCILIGVAPESREVLADGNPPAGCTHTETTVVEGVEHEVEVDGCENGLSCCNGSCYSPGQSSQCCEGKSLYNPQTQECCSDGSVHPKQ